MFRYPSAILFAAVAFHAALVAAEPASPRFEVMVAGDKVRLSDLFTDLDPARDTIITNAPAPGRSMVFDTRFLSRLARLYRIGWEPVTGSERTIVRRGSVEIGPDTVRSVIAEALASMIPVGRIDVQLDDPRLSFHMPLDQPDAIGVDYIELPQPSNRFRSIIIVGEGKDAQRVHVSGRAVGIVEVPTLIRWIRPGEIVTASDVGWIEAQYSPNAGDLITDDSDLIGMTPRRPVAVNRPLRQRDFHPPRLVEKGSLVTMVVRSPWMLLTARGRALDHGGRGDVIRVANTQSNRIVEGTVIGAGEVSVGSTGANLLMN